MKCLFTLFSLVLLTGAAVKNGSAQNLVKVAPNAKVILENDKIRAIDVWLKKGEKIAMHSHPDHIVYFLSDGKMKTSFADGKSGETEPKTGNAVWSNAVVHANENIGSTDMHVLVIELKGSETKSEVKK